MAADRTFTDVFADIVRNLQDIIRSEVRLAKTELKEEVASARSSAVLLGAGTVSAIFGLFFVLVAIVLALAEVLPAWGAALVVAMLLLALAGAALWTGVKTLRQLQVLPKTMETLKDTSVRHVS